MAAACLDLVIKLAPIEVLCPAVSVKPRNNFPASRFFQIPTNIVALTRETRATSRRAAISFQGWNHIRLVRKTQTHRGALVTSCRERARHTWITLKRKCAIQP
ncbi:unnamed protein product [Ixodes persulcatus]